MAQRKTLAERQVAVLRWIADGCPRDVMEGDSHRISAAALRNRGLVTVSGHGASWVAEITQTGREYLEQVDGPEPPMPRQANVSVTQQLVDDVIAAGGSLRAPRRNWYQRCGVARSQNGASSSGFGSGVKSRRTSTTRPTSNGTSAYPSTRPTTVAQSTCTPGTSVPSSSTTTTRLTP
jgi:hypothetical protein